MVDQTGHPENEPHPQGTTSLARALVEARQSGRLVERSNHQVGVAAGYAYQGESRSIYVAAGDRVVGYKVGLSSRPAREALAAEEPVSGYLLGSKTLEGAETYSLDGLTNPRVEAEIAFVIGSELSGEHVTADDVVEATRELAISLEIVASRWSEGPGSVGLLVADDVSAAGVVLGERSPAYADIRAITVSVEVGGTRTHGSGSNVFDHPAKSVAWLVSHLTRAGERLNVGDLVMSGSLNTPFPVASGDVLVADFGALGQITTTFTA